MESLSVFVTGAGGFIGSHLIDFLAGRGHEVSGTYFGNINLVDEIGDKAVLRFCDIRSKEKLKQIIRDCRPERIYHLAAQSYPTASWEDPYYTMETNVTGTINLFEIVKELRLNPRILVAGSSAQYGFVTPDEVPVKESHMMKPLHPYGVSKVAQENLAYQYSKNFGIDCFTLRIFNTTGPRKVNDVCSDFTKQIAAVELGLQKPVMYVGNLETSRAVTDVRDVVRGFYSAMQKVKAGEALNINGSRPYQIKELLDIALSLSDAEPEIKVDQKLLRPTDEPVIFGDCSKLVTETGWKQEIPIEKTLDDMLKYWRWKLQKQEKM